MLRPGDSGARNGTEKLVERKFEKTVDLKSDIHTMLLTAFAPCCMWQMSSAAPFVPTQKRSTG